MWKYLRNINVIEISLAFWFYVSYVFFRLKVLFLSRACTVPWRKALIHDLFSLDLAKDPYLCGVKPAQPHLEPRLVTSLLSPRSDVVLCDL